MTNFRQESDMGYNVVGATAWEELERNVRNVPLSEKVEGELVFPYEDATIQLKRVFYDEVRPTSLYVLRARLAVQATIMADVARHGYDPLNLEEGLILTHGDNSDRIGFVPPIVEETSEDGQYVLDGMHRTGLGRWLGLTSFIAIHISGIRKDCPAYAYPNEWHELRIHEKLPSELSERKKHREVNYRRLYRIFTEVNASEARISSD